MKNYGPSSGYDSAAKKRWRDAVWFQISRNIPLSERRYATVFVIESLDGFEIEKAIKLGFAVGNIHACNASAAVVATLSRRFPGITTYGVSASRAIGRAYKRGVLFDAVSLDFCCCACADYMDTVAKVRYVISDSGSSVVAVNVLRGRESKKFRTSDRSLDAGAIIPDAAFDKHSLKRRGELSGSGDGMRLWATYVPLVAAVAPSDENGPVMLPSIAGQVVDFGSYKSSTQTMLYTVFKVWSIYGAVAQGRGA